MNKDKELNKNMQIQDIFASIRDTIHNDVHNGVPIPDLTKKRISYHISQGFVNTLQPTGETICYWDDTLHGFGVRVRKKTKTYVVFYRNKFKKSCWLTLGPSNILTADEARRLAHNALHQNLIQKLHEKQKRLKNLVKVSLPYKR